MSDAPQVQARVIIDPEHPEAGNGGVVPPVHSRFVPGRSGNPGGRPPAADIGAAIMRELAKNPDADGIGEGAQRVARSLIAAATIPSTTEEGRIDTKAALALLDRASGPIVKEIDQTLSVRGVTIKGVEVGE